MQDARCKMEIDARSTRSEGDDRGIERKSHIAPRFHQDRRGRQRVRPVALSACGNATTGSEEHPTSNPARSAHHGRRLFLRSGPALDRRPSPHRGLQHHLSEGQNRRPQHPRVQRAADSRGDRDRPPPLHARLRQRRCPGLQPAADLPAADLPPQEHLHPHRPGNRQARRSAWQDHRHSRVTLRPR